MLVGADDATGSADVDGSADDPVVADAVSPEPVPAEAAGAEVTTATTERTRARALNSEAARRPLDPPRRPIVRCCDMTAPHRRSASSPADIDTTHPLRDIVDSWRPVTATARTAAGDHDQPLSAPSSGAGDAHIVEVGGDDAVGVEGEMRHLVTHDAGSVLSEHPDRQRERRVRILLVSPEVAHAVAYPLQDTPSKVTETLDLSVNVDKFSSGRPIVFLASLNPVPPQSPAAPAMPDRHILRGR